MELSLIKQELDDLNVRLIGVGFDPDLKDLQDFMLYPFIHLKYYPLFPISSFYYNIYFSFCILFFIINFNITRGKKRAQNIVFLKIE